MKLITIKNNSEIFSVQLGVKVGSMNESPEEKGLSHFVEHMVFKGTKNRDSNKINEDIEEMAGNFIAYTTYSETVFGFTGLEEEFEKGLDLVSDLVINPIFPKNEFEKEKYVIISEIKRSLDDIEEYTFRTLHETAFENSFLKSDIAGEISEVKNYKIEDLKKYYDSHYIPNRSHIVLVSNLDHETMYNKALDKLGLWEKKDPILPKISDEKNKNISKLFYKKDIEQSSLGYLFSFYGLNRKEELALEILNYSLGESPNSILFKRLREELGITYDVYSDINTNNNIKLLSIYTSVDHNNISLSEKEIDSIIEKIKVGKLIENRNINIMKKVIKTSIVSVFNDPESLGNYILGQMLFEKHELEFMEDLEILNTIVKEEIIEVANKVLSNETKVVMTLKE